MKNKVFFAIFFVLTLSMYGQDKNSKIAVFEFISEDISLTNYKVSLYQDLVVITAKSITNATVVKKPYELKSEFNLDIVHGEMRKIAMEANCDYYIFGVISQHAGYITTSLELVELKSGFSKKSSVIEKYNVEIAPSIKKATEKLLKQTTDLKPSKEIVDEHISLFKQRDFVKVIGGVFKMGGDYHKLDNRPAHSVEVKSFYVSPYEVTNLEFEKFINETEYNIATGAYFYNDKGQMVLSKTMNWKNPGYEYKPYNPVTCVSWYDAIYYCNWLSKKHNERPYYEIDEKFNISIDKYSNGYRLLTESEWEYAASDGGKKNTIFSGSDKIDEVAVYRNNSNGKPLVVGNKKNNYLNIYDMSGNVFEWCYDIYNSKKYLGIPSSKEDSNYRVYRGGSWRSTPFNCLVISRFYNNPNIRSNLLGFRIAKNTVVSKEVVSFNR